MHSKRFIFKYKQQKIDQNKSYLLITYDRSKANLIPTLNPHRSLWPSRALKAIYYIETHKQSTIDSREIFKNSCNNI